MDAGAAALGAPASERIAISHSAQRYSVANYVRGFQHIISKVLNISSKPVEHAPVISVSKRLPETMAA